MGKDKKVHPGTCKPRGLVGCVSPDLVNNTCQHPSEFESILPVSEREKP